MKSPILSVVVLCLFACLTVRGAEGETSNAMEILPKSRPFRLTFADPREIRLALTFEGDSKINAAVGNYFSLFAIRPQNGEDWLFHFGLEGAGYFTMRHALSRFPLETADGLIGVYAERSNGPWQWQLRFTHVSAHLADGTTEVPIAYSRETLFGRFGYVPSDTLQVYGGVGYLVNSTPKLPPLQIQLGGAYFLPWGPTKIVPFLAADLKWKQESETKTSLTVQLGLALNNPPQAYRSFRFFYAYFTGANPRGQFYDRSYTSHSIGIDMQI